MRWTLPPLAILAVLGGGINLPALYGGGEALRAWLGPVAGQVAQLSHQAEWVLAGMAGFLFLLGWALARWRYLPAPSPGESLPARFLLHGWEADRLVDALLVRPFGALAVLLWQGVDGRLVDGFLESLGRGSLLIGEGLRRFTTGRLHSYLAAFGLGLVCHARLVSAGVPAMSARD